MSTATKQASKKDSKVSKESDNSDLENSDMENDKHSIFNGDFKKNSEEAKYFLKHFNAIKEEFLDEESESKILKHIWGESYESLSELVKKNNKKEKIKKAKFTPSSLEKPKKAIDIFGKKFSEDSKANDIKFSKDNNYLVCRKAAWDNLNKLEQAKYEKQAKAQKDNYDIEYAKLKAEAIKNGEFPEDKIKGPLTAYFLFLDDVRPKLTEKFKGETERNTKITKEGGKMWKELSEKEKDKYIAKYKEAKAEYDIKKQEWNSNEIQRVKKQDNLPADIKVESSGNKKVEKEKSTKKEILKPISEDEAEVSEAEVAEVKTTKPKSKKEKTTPVKKAVVKPESDDEQEQEKEESEVEEVIVEKPKAKSPVKAKASKAK
jgi:hypothetical protein